MYVMIFSDLIKYEFCNTFVTNLWYPPFSLMEPEMCGVYYLGNDKYENAYCHNSSIYVVVKESNLPRGHRLSCHLSPLLPGKGE